MIPEFRKLSDDEVELLVKAPILVCILIAGADDHIDNNEIRKAIDLAKKRQEKLHTRLVELYLEVGEDFEDKLKILIQSFPLKEKDRSPIIVEQLSKLNSVFPLIEKSFVKDYYNSLKELAIGVAKSSGGVLGISSVGDKEAEYINLEMIKDPSIN
jgi:hypothetical protein